MVERAHALRAPFKRRYYDWIWLVGVLTIFGGFGSIAIVGFIWPMSSISEDDGRCRIGLPRYVTIPLLSFDVMINTYLNFVFIYLLSPLVRSGGLVSRVTKSLGSFGNRSRARNGVDLLPANRQMIDRIERLLWKTLIGACLVLLPTAGNMASLTVLNGRELGWVCLTVCTLDGATATLPSIRGDSKLM